LLDQFFDRAICYATEGYEQYARMHPELGKEASHNKDQATFA
jgi:hypothetical protein